MKNISLILLTAFVFIGCTIKEQTDVKPYVTLHENAKQNIKINLLEVSDKRSTFIVSTITNDGKIENEYPLSAEIKTWYTEAFIRELKNIDMLDIDKKSDIDVLINIQNISAIYKKYSLDKKNMRSNVKIELIIKQNGKTITSQIENKQTMYKPMILDAAGFETIINESMSDSVSKTISVLIKKIKE